MGGAAASATPQRLRLRLRRQAAALRSLPAPGARGAVGASAPPHLTPTGSVATAGGGAPTGAATGAVGPYEVGSAEGVGSATLGVHGTGAGKLGGPRSPDTPPGLCWRRPLAGVVVAGAEAAEGDRAIAPASSHAWKSAFDESAVVVVWRVSAKVSYVPPSPGLSNCSASFLPSAATEAPGRLTDIPLLLAPPPPAPGEVPPASATMQPPGRQDELPEVLHALGCGIAGASRGVDEGRGTGEPAFQTFQVSAAAPVPAASTLNWPGPVGVRDLRRLRSLSLWGLWP
mmetsp:Transcript_7649/g.21221  ORF Transcript_7649/g.21221 Transcript_7649/m.21221 type:complete len:286 (+) Transcript_7649:846-1703(+)